MPRAKTTKPKKELIEPAPAVVSPVQIPEPDDEDVVISEEKFEQGSALGPGGKEKYFQAIGRRKESVARVRLYTKKSTDKAEDDKALIIINDKDYTDYFSDKTLQMHLEAPLRKLKSLNRFKATVHVSGGGMSGQADAVRHGLARALEQFDINFRKKLKKAGYLTRDPREKERRKYGHKKARKSPRWSKR